MLTGSVIAHTAPKPGHSGQGTQQQPGLLHIATSLGCSRKAAVRLWQSGYSIVVALLASQHDVASVRLWLAVVSVSLEVLLHCTTSLATVCRLAPTLGPWCTHQAAVALWWGCQAAWHWCTVSTCIELRPTLCCCWRSVSLIDSSRC